ncbi:hypothetical protein QL285_067905 [Trifolium repens]|nr:hypothetical protein QL285_067905 [Trifolium repens]
MIYISLSSFSSSASPFSFLFDGRPSLLLRPFPVLFVYSLFAGVSPVFMVDPASVGGLKVFGLLRFGLVKVVVAALVAVFALVVGGVCNRMFFLGVWSVEICRFQVVLSACTSMILLLERAFMLAA